jgi:putative phosphoesterase
MLVGLVSDTHSLIRPEVFTALAGVDLILHAGDVGGSNVLVELGAIAPIQAVYGNTDGPGDPNLRGRLLIDVDGLSIHVSHGHEVGSPTPEKLLARYDADVIVFGHTHKPLVERSGSRLVVNPGAAGPRRFSLKPSVARMTVNDGRAEVEIVWL